ncbi:MATE family efflux transporter [Halomarina litorea]|uniref:MATE family efflux transporter n=1 Tax=Halomarina litorea TaxID=2961595 RepID=UPI0020C546B8|nr:MATE family efflux transporter [Halomarina sp. BCD28]
MFDLSSDDITEGPVVRAMLVLAAPLLAQNVVQVLQTVIDLFWLGRLDPDAVAAVGLVATLQSLVFAVAIWAPLVGTQVLVAQRIGADDIPGARNRVFVGLVTAILLAVVLGVVGVVGARPVIDLLTSTRPESVAGAVPDYAVAYFTVTMVGLPVLVLADTTEAAYVGWGDSRMALYMNLLAVGVNLVLDPLLIFGYFGFPELGVQGAALATVAGYGLGGVLGLWFALAGRNGGMLTRAAARFDLPTARELLAVGLPISGQQLAKQSADLLLVLVAFTLGGPAGLVAYTVGHRVATLAVIPSGSLQQAAQSIIGQNLGAGFVGRAHRATWLGAILAGGVLGVVGLVQWLIPSTLTTLFVPTLGEEALSLSIEYLRVLAYSYPAIGVAYLFQAGFNAAGRTTTSFVASLLQYWGIRLPVAVVGGGLVAAGLGLSMGVSAVFWAVTGSNLLAAVGLGAYYNYSAENGMLDRAAEAAAA